MAAMIAFQGEDLQHDHQFPSHQSMNNTTTSTKYMLERTKEEKQKKYTTHFQIGKAVKLKMHGQLDPRKSTVLSAAKNDHHRNTVPI
jgi:hypothetical protein